MKFQFDIQLKQMESETTSQKEDIEDRKDKRIKWKVRNKVINKQRQNDLYLRF